MMDWECHLDAAAWDHDVGPAAVGSDAEPDPDDDVGSEPEPDCIEDVTADEASREVANMLIDLRLQSHLSARQVCTLAWWLAKAGLQGVVADLAVHPDRSSGQYSKHFDLIAGTRAVDIAEDFYVADVAIHSRTQAKRIIQPMPVFTPLDALAEEIKSTPDMQAKLEACIEANALPQRYFDHIVKQRAPPGVPVYPCFLYIDGLKFQRTDGMVRITVKCLVTHVNHLCMAIRKSEMCACGCRGWCTIYVAMLVLGWSFEAMGDGIWFNAKHDGTPWEEGSWRQKLAGTALGWFALIIFARCDMAEFVTTFGFPSWNTVEHPCPSCFCTAGDMYSVCGLSAVSLPWPPKTLANYFAACAACEIRVDASPTQVRALRMSLRYDKRDTGSRGRALEVSFPDLGLIAGDRLEPTHRMPDVGAAVDRNSTENVSLVFWRRCFETITRRRNPVFSERTGIEPDTFFVPDWLHCLSLGVYKVMINFAWHTLFETNVFKLERSSLSTADAFIEVNVDLLKELLFQWYKDEHRQKREHAKLQTLTAAMVGTHSGHALGTWGAETNGQLFFTRWRLSKYQHKLPEDRSIHLTRGVSSLVSIHESIKAWRKGVPPLEEIQAFADNWKLHMHALRALDIQPRPKHHQMAHMVNLLRTSGAPMMWGTWVEEGENHETGRMAIRAHRAVWAWRVLGDHRAAYGVRRRVRRTK